MTAKGKKIKTKETTAAPGVETKTQPSFLLKRVWNSERAAGLADLRKYVFVVEKKANKPEVKKAIETIYRVKVQDVNIINQKPKKRRLGASAGKVPGMKKAIVTLAEGQKIDIVQA